MADTIRGPVTKVIDGDTFDMKVTHVGKKNEYEYGDIERIRIAEIDAPELNSIKGKRAKEELEKAILGKVVRCYIQSRDSFNRIVAKVELV